ncbi:MAG: isochorismate synthase [Prevotella sp.]|nr:isochorismate synthase [Prevotella sp.]
MQSFAIYRLPHADHATMIRQTDGAPAELLSCEELNDRQGFVFAPFQVTPQQPILLIRPDEVEALECRVKGADFAAAVPPALASTGQANSPLSTPYSPFSTQHPPLSAPHSPLSTYAVDFANFHAQILQGTFRKIVLARCADEAVDPTLEPMTLFWQACERYPRLFISLIYTPKSGCWLTATPEILLEGSGNEWRTIALAGTMRLEADQMDGEGETLTWSTKNIQEQRIVATYITECLEQFTGDFSEQGPYTARAANLVHLRSDFTFSLPDGSRLGSLLHTLHPTPAVCGLPKRDAFNFIVANEHSPRRYYSGFQGALNLPSLGTHLYVSLRCMNIAGRQCRLYAGGGLLPESDMQQEWQETEAKMQTMRALLK